jgi:hypothetical protein
VWAALVAYPDLAADGGQLSLRDLEALFGLRMNVIGHAGPRRCPQLYAEDVAVVLEAKALLCDRILDDVVHLCALHAEDLSLDAAQLRAALERAAAARD